MRTAAPGICVSRSFAANKPFALWFALFLLAGCRNKDAEPPDHPRISSNVILRDVTFRSAALSREMRYRVILPAIITAHRQLPVVYLLHGNGGSFRDWSNYSDVARYAETNLVLVMPQGVAFWAHARKPIPKNWIACSPRIRTSRHHLAPIACSRISRPAIARQQFECCWPRACLWTPAETWEARLCTGPVGKVIPISSRSYWLTAHP